MMSSEKETMHRIALVVIRWASSTITDTQALEQVKTHILPAAKQVKAIRTRQPRYRKPTKH